MELIPLKIPAGYAITYNKFYDVEPIRNKDEDDFIENWGYFTEDLLQIVKMKIQKGNWYVPEREDKLLFDLGWYPDSDINGQYVLQLVDENWYEIKSISSRDRLIIKETLEAWMEEHQRL